MESVDALNSKVEVLQTSVSSGVEEKVGSVKVEPKQKSLLFTVNSVTSELPDLAFSAVSTIW